jgi:hypothetical protein
MTLNSTVLNDTAFIDCRRSLSVYTKLNFHRVVGGMIESSPIGKHVCMAGVVITPHHYHTTEKVVCQVEKLHMHIYGSFHIVRTYISNI